MTAEYITNSAGTTITGLTVVAGTAQRLRCYSTDGSSDVRINACRIDCREESPTGEAAATATAQGQNIIDDGLIEGRLVGGEWQNICKFTNALQLGSIAAGGYTEFEVRANTADGIIAFGLCVRAQI
jgi:hypothetical protein